MVDADLLSSRAVRKRQVPAAVADQLQRLGIKVTDVRQFSLAKLNHELALACVGNLYANAVEKTSISLLKDDLERTTAYCNPFPNLASLKLNIFSVSVGFLALKIILDCGKSQSSMFNLYLDLDCEPQDAADDRDASEATIDEYLMSHLIDEIIATFAKKSELTFSIALGPDGGRLRPPWFLALAQRLVKLIATRNCANDSLLLYYDAELWCSVSAYLRLPVEYKFKLHLDGPVDSINSLLHYAPNETRWQNLSLEVAPATHTCYLRGVADIVMRRVPPGSRFSLNISFVRRLTGANSVLEDQVPTEGQMQRSMSIPTSLSCLKLPDLESLESASCIDCPLTARHVVLKENCLPRRAFDYLNNVQVLDLTQDPSLSRRVLIAVQSGDWGGSSNLRALLVSGPAFGGSQDPIALEYDRLHACFPNLIDFAAVTYLDKPQITGHGFHQASRPFSVDMYGAIQVARQQIAAFTLAVELAGVSLTRDVLERAVLPVIASVERRATYTDA
eukprot:TRINITY_DN6643_c0_g1_i1.p1 TRINITY_DN6643_c0_g1~~TRINITY_DN6643_c0_g1_i1.p1  ORF type:complete len:505 (+),score=53.91 TRINITY_DN6643_c0_g1_i1:45-1559(+)